MVSPGVSQINSRRGAVALATVIIWEPSPGDTRCGDITLAGARRVLGGLSVPPKPPFDSATA